MIKPCLAGPIGLGVLVSSLAIPAPLAGQPSGAGPRPVTFNRDIAGIIFQHCTSCHRTGEAAPFTLQTYEDVRQRAQLIADTTAQRYMPPWMPEPEVGEFEGVRRLTETQIDLIRQWVADGAPEGDRRDLPHPPAFTAGWQLGPPDLVVSMPAAFAMPADGPDLFRNFVLPLSIRSRRYVRAVEFRPGGAKSIHHARILLDDTRESRWRDDRDPGVGFAGMDAPGARFPEGHFLGWAAGKSATQSSLSWPLEPGSDLVVQMHLKPTGRAESIRASIGFYFSNKPPTSSPVMLRLGPQTVDIPPGETDHVISDSYELPVDAEALRISPHAHYLGRDIAVAARMPDGRVERLLHITHWDFNWQDDYEYSHPVSLPRGSSIQMRYVYDNSENNPHNPNVPPARVRFGPLATDEMAELIVQLVPKRPGDLGTLRADVARKTLMTSIAGEEKRVADSPDDVETRNLLGTHYVQTGRADAAVAQFEAALRVNPDHAITNYNLAVMAIGRQEYEIAQKHFQRALTTRPDYPEAHTNFGVLLKRTGKLNEAVGHFRAALAVKPGNAAARNNLGLVLLELRRPDEAVVQFQELVRLQPENPQALDALASAYAEAGEFMLAIGVGQQALSRALAARNESLARAIRQRLLVYQQQREAAFP
jgi:tetratricopeptide (TPR) repeat protein